MEFKHQAPRLCVACDGMSPKEVFVFLKKLKNPEKIIIKIGLGNMFQFSTKDLWKIKSTGAQLFIDAKLHDIPSQVGRAVQFWTDKGADYLTIHLSGGPQMIKESLLKSSKGKRKSTLLGVSVLTSLGNSEMSAMGDIRTPKKWALSLIQMGLRVGLKSFVCSAADLPFLKKKLGENIFSKITWVTPGVVGLKEKKHGDQKRVVNYVQAAESGSKVLVMGRSIFRAPAPYEMVSTITKEIGIIYDR